MISNIRHPNLVEFIGCCVEGNHRILVYEYLENNSLASALLGNNQIIGVLWNQLIFQLDEFKFFLNSVYYAIVKL